MAIPLRTKAMQWRRLWSQTPLVDHAMGEAPERHARARTMLVSLCGSRLRFWAMRTMDERA
eukprot:4312958-Pleurochrysis_carterae.AAC.4